MLLVSFFSFMFPSGSVFEYFLPFLSEPPSSSPPPPPSLSLSLSLFCSSFLYVFFPISVLSPFFCFTSFLSSPPSFQVLSFFFFFLFVCLLLLFLFVCLFWHSFSLPYLLSYSVPFSFALKSNFLSFHYSVFSFVFCCSCCCCRYLL